MHPTEAIANPFALLTSPELIFAAIERSDRLARLKSTICRPLDTIRPEASAADADEGDDDGEPEAFDEVEADFGL